jgi:tryptophanyl-tRNA synthetase
MERWATVYCKFLNSLSNARRSPAPCCGALYLLKRTRKPHMSSSERQHAMEISDAQRTYAEKMYDPPTDEEQAVTRRSRK